MAENLSDGFGASTAASTGFGSGLAGAGFGGAVVALVAAGAAREVAAAVLEAYGPGGQLVVPAPI